MKLLSVVLLLIVMQQALAQGPQGSQGYQGYQGPSRPQCPREGPADCLCPQDWRPVCSTQGCTFSNYCQLSCAEQTFAYKGRCRHPYGGYGGYRPAPAPAQPAGYRPAQPVGYIPASAPAQPVLVQH